MELKKNPKVDLRRYSGLFLEVGFVVAIGAVLLALNYSVHTKNTVVFGELKTVIAEEGIVPITRQQAKTPPPPPEIPKVAEVINIVDDDTNLDDELDIEDIEADQETEIIVVKRQEEEEDDEIFIIVEEIPEFPGGEDALHRFMIEHTKYPKNAKKNKVSGTVYVQFVINENGEIENVQIPQSVDPALDREAIRVVKSMPNWIPGKIRGKPVKALQTLWFDFVSR
ncbi:MAG: energy transducer TonB [Salinivirgaceae bacterium]|nr:energy transducer TonB [Salinivirgaceae bacterium]